MALGHRSYFLVAGAFFYAVLSIASPNAAAQPGSGCKVLTNNGDVAVVLCPPGVGQEQWQRAGSAACGNVKSCSAWIWDDVKKAPLSAPSQATDIAQKDMLNSVAIWDNAEQRLIMIERVK